MMPTSRFALGTASAGILLAGLAVAAICHTRQRPALALTALPPAVPMKGQPFGGLQVRLPRGLPLTSLPARPVAPQQNPVASGPFTEKPSRQEMPEIRLTEQTAEHHQYQLLLAGQPGRYRLNMTGTTASITVPPGAYRYEFYSPAYRITGRPDQDGTITCRRFKLYEVTIIDAEGSETHHQDLGDE
jgi:hypothetical protein